MAQNITILFLGDVIGQPGNRAVFTHLKRIAKREAADISIVNGENAAAGFGLTPETVTNLFDAGATVNCKAAHLVQFAQMGACYARSVLQRAHPVVGLLSVGEEDAKGNAVTKDAFRQLRESPLQFYGNVEGLDVAQRIRDLEHPTEIVLKSGFPAETPEIVRRLKALNLFAILDKSAQTQAQELLDTIRKAAAKTKAT